MKNIKKLIFTIILYLSFSNLTFASDPELSGNTSLYLFDSARDPTATEPNVAAIGIPTDWLFDWYNHTTGNVYNYKGGTSGSYIWDLIITDKNLNSALANAGWALNTSRDYSPITLAFGTSRTPNLNNDVEVIANISQSSILITAATVSVQVNTSGTWVVLGTPSLSGLAGSQINMITFIVPKGASYRFVLTSGTNAILNINELIM